MAEENRYVALVSLLMPQGPGAIPSVLRFARGDVFSLDGDEPIDVGLLLRSGAMRPYNPSDKPVAGTSSPSKSQKPPVGHRPALRLRDRR